MELYVESRGLQRGRTRLGSTWLIQFSPFGFIANFLVFVQVKRGSRNLFKLKLEGELTGPRPLHIKGKITFEILWLDITVGFDKTLVSGEAPPPPEPVTVMDQLVAALEDPRNWGGQPADGNAVWSRCENPRRPISYAPPYEPVVGETDVVPLDFQISKFGDSHPLVAACSRSRESPLAEITSTSGRDEDSFAPVAIPGVERRRKLAPRPSNR